MTSTAAPTSAPAPAVAERPPLTPENAHTFWQAAWDTNQTGWKQLELDRVVFSKNIAAFEATVRAVQENTCKKKDGGDDNAIAAATATEEEKKKKDGDDNAIAAATATASGFKGVFEEHRAVFVPLCGDTYATRFFADGFLKTGCDSGLKQITAQEEGEAALFTCLSEYAAANANTNSNTKAFCVMGVDLSPDAITGNMKHFPELKFSETKVVVEAESADTPSSSFTHFFARAINPNAYAKAVAATTADDLPSFVDIHLFVGDYFAVTKWWAGQAKNMKGGEAIPIPFIDFSYDRASMVAMHPSLRQRYVDGVRAVMGGNDNDEKKRKQRIFLELVERREGKRDVGPPFHVPKTDVAADAVVVAENDNATPSSSSSSSSFFYGAQWRRADIPFDCPELTETPVISFKKHLLFKQ